MNVMNTYIKLTKKFLSDYGRLVLDKKFNKKLSDEFIEEYIEARYNELENYENRSELKFEVLNRLDQKSNSLIEEYPEEKEIIEHIREIYDYVFYFDNVIQSKDIERVVNNIYEKRKEILGKEDEEFSTNLMQLCEKYNKEIQELQEKIKSAEFYLRNRRLSEENELYEAYLMYNIKFPMLYSTFAIQKAFDTDKICEDKQFITFHLLVGQIIKDIIQGKLKKQYVVEFTDTILEKKQKTNSLLETITNPTIQDKISLKVKYTNFLKNRDNIYELMQKGFRISILLDDSFILNENELKKLDIFKFVLVSRNHKYYEAINDSEIHKKVIELP